MQPPSEFRPAKFLDSRIIERAPSDAHGNLTSADLRTWFHLPLWYSRAIAPVSDRPMAIGPAVLLSTKESPVREMSGTGNAPARCKIFESHLGLAQASALCFRPEANLHGASGSRCMGQMGREGEDTLNWAFLEGVYMIEV